MLDRVSNSMLLKYRSPKKLYVLKGKRLAQTRMLVVLALKQAVHGVRECNRWEGYHVSFSPDGKMLALITKDGTVQFGAVMAPCSKPSKGRTFRSLQMWVSVQMA